MGLDFYFDLKPYQKPVLRGATSCVHEQVDEWQNHFMEVLETQQGQTMHTKITLKDKTTAKKESTSLIHKQ